MRWRGGGSAKDRRKHERVSLTVRRGGLRVDGWWSAELYDHKSGAGANASGFEMRVPGERHVDVRCPSLLGPAPPPPPTPGPAEEALVLPPLASAAATLRGTGCMGGHGREKRGKRGGTEAPRGEETGGVAVEWTALARWCGVFSTTLSHISSKPRTEPACHARGRAAHAVFKITIFPPSFWCVNRLPRDSGVNSR